MIRSALRAGLAVTMLATALVGAAVAQQSPAISLDPTSGEVGDSVTVSGGGFEGTGSVSVFLDRIGGLLLTTTAIANRNGDLQRATFRIPDVSPGSHDVLACRYVPETAECLGGTARATLRILEPPPPTTTTTTPTTTTTTPPTTTTTTPTTTTNTQQITTTTTVPPATTTTPGTSTTTDATELSPTTTSTLGLATVTTIGGDPPGPSSPTGVAFSTTSTSIDFGGATNFESGDETDFPDLEITAVEVTQGIQDLGNRMPLIAGKRTLVRVYVAADRSEGEVGDVQAGPSDDVSEVGVDGWEPVDGLLHLRGNGRDDIVYAVNAPIAAYRRGSDRLAEDETLNFELPAEWTTGEVEMTVLVWSFLPETILTEEPDAGNNFAQGTLGFNEAEAPKVIWFRLDTPSGGLSSESYTSAMEAATFSYVTFHPVATPDFLPIFATLGPGEMVGDDEPSENFDYVDNRTEPLNRMRFLHAQWGLEELERMHGLIPEGTASDGGGLTSWNSLVAWSKPTETTPAHEGAHMYFIKHAPCQDADGDGQPDEVGGGGWGWIDQTHPTGLPSCSIGHEDPGGYYGVRMGEGLAEFETYSNDPGLPPVRYPFMGYQGPKWIDAYHYCLLMETYGVVCDPASIGLDPLSPPGPPVDCGPPLGGGIVVDLCLWNGQAPIDQQGGTPGSVQVALPVEPPAGYLLVHVDIDRLALGHAELLVPTDQSETELDFLVHRAKRGEMSNVTMLRVVDSDGELLAQLPASSPVGGHSETAGVEGAVEMIPWYETATAIELIHEGEVVDRRATSAPPAVTIDPVDAGASREFAVSWSGNDPDGDELRYTVSWSVDEGASWRVVDTLMTGTTARMSEDLVLPGGEVLIKVTASDGLSTGTAIAGPFAVPGGTPSGFVVAPETVPQHSGHVMTFLANDPEDGSIRSGTWVSNLDGTLGEGHRMAMSDLSIGRHEIAVTVTDSGGNEATLLSEVQVTEWAGPSPRTAGAVPDAEMLVRLGPDDLDRFEIAPGGTPEDQPVAVAESTETAGPPWVAIGASLGLALIATAGLIIRRSRLSSGSRG